MLKYAAAGDPRRLCAGTMQHGAYRACAVHDAQPAFVSNSTPMAIHLVVLMCVLNHSGYVGSRVVMSLYALSLGADQFSIGIIMSLYALCPMLLAISAGKLVDRVGPRLPMLAGTIGTFVGLLLPYVFPGLVTLYIAAFMLGTSFQFFFVVNS